MVFYGRVHEINAYYNVQVCEIHIVFVFEWFCVGISQYMVLNEFICTIIYVIVLCADCSVYGFE